AQLEELANLLETRSFLSLPVRSRNQTIGRLYVALQRVRYPVNHLRFLEQIMNQAGLMIENMQLVERLTLEVASEERKKISRDLHDGTIQPYVGLKLGLEALRRKVNADAHVARELEELIKIAADGINQLRHYVGHLKGSTGNKASESLLPAVRQQAAKFSEYYGIHATVVADGDITVNARLFEEVMFIVREGLSNIRRHSSSEHARLSLNAGEHCLVLEFVNDNGCGDETPADVFFPRTIGERARELGGQVHVQHRPGGETAVTVEIPV
ncbi:MAG TPA: histidine kinase, partial [Burkholderiales bacterium]|nr:histidine kinase [Burkholderiales bacterium]